MNRKLLVSFAPLLAIAAFAVVPAAAQAFQTYWEVKTPGPWHKLAVGATETLTGEAAALKIVGADEHKAFTSTCNTKLIETIENEVITGEGIDEMAAFVANCAASAPAPFPCSTGESYSIVGEGSPWPSELVIPTYDAVEKVEVRVECESTKTALYHPPGHLWNLKFGPNVLVPLEVAGVFKNKHIPGGNYFYFKGNTTHAGDEITLKPENYVGVR